MRRKGFTLIELLVVIAIIGILATVVLGALNSARQRARDAKRISDMKSIQLSLELFADSCAGAYLSKNPAAVLALTDACATDAAVTISDFLPTIPTNSTPGGVPYTYCSATFAAPGTCAASTESFIIDFSLEQPTAGLTAGAHTARPNQLL